MGTVLRTIGRLLWVAIAFLLSMLAAMIVLTTLGLETLTHAISNIDDADLMFDAYDFFWTGTVVVSGATLIPALLVVIAGEVGRIRSWLYYMIGGGVALIIIPLLARIDPTALNQLALPSIWQVFATAGFAGGIVYWLLAGRNA